MYGGQHGWLQPSFEYGGSQGPVDWFVTGDYLHNDIGIENPAPTYDALHDTDGPVPRPALCLRHHRS